MEESRASGERLAAAVDRLSRSHEEFSRISRGETVTPAPEPDPELHAENARLRAEIREIRQQLEVSTALVKALAQDNRSKDASIALLKMEVARLGADEADAGPLPQVDH